VREGGEHVEEAGVLGPRHLALVGAHERLPRARVVSRVSPTKAFASAPSAGRRAA
jgi:hypothetical protein